MASANSGHSPNIEIHIEIGQKKIRLSDVLYNSATLFETTEVAPNTRALLVFVVDDLEEREEIILEHGISIHDSLIKFSYTNPDRINGRHFSW